MKKLSKLTILIATVFIIAFAFPHPAAAAPNEEGRTVFGESYTLESGRILDGDLNVIGGVVTVEASATVNGNVFVLGGLVTINGTVEGDLTAVGGTVNLEENAVIQGDLISPASFITRDANAVVQGNQYEGWNIPWTDFDLPFVYQPNVIRTPSFRILPVLSIIGREIAITLVLAALGAFLLLIMPKSAEVMTQAFISKPWHLLGYGALTAMVMLVGGVILTITICLIPVVILLGLAFGLAVLVGWLALGYELGKRIASSIFKTTWHPVLSAALGNLVLYLFAKSLELIPCIGGFLVFIAMLFGLGAAVVTFFGTKSYPLKTSDPYDGQIELFPNTDTTGADILRLAQSADVEEDDDVVEVNENEALDKDVNQPPSEDSDAEPQE